MKSDQICLWLLILNTFLLLVLLYRSSDDDQTRLRYRKWRAVF